MYSTQEIIEKVNKTFLAQLMISDVELKPTTSISDDLPVDSLDHVELIMAIEEEFDIKIADEESELCVTMQDAYKLVADKLGVEYTYDVSNKQSKEGSMPKLKREDLLGTKWDARKWTREMKTRWQEKMFELGIKWWSPFVNSSKIQDLDKDYYFINKKGCIFYGVNRQTYDSSLELVTAYYTDVFQQDKVLQVDTAAGSGVHAESGSVNDTRKNVPSKDTSALDTLCNMCQEHGLYMTFDPHGEVIVADAGSDVEYKVNSEDELEKLLSAIEVLKNYAQ